MIFFMFVVKISSVRYLIFVGKSYSLSTSFQSNMIMVSISDNAAATHSTFILHFLLSSIPTFWKEKQIARWVIGKLYNRTVFQHLVSIPIDGAFYAPRCLFCSLLVLYSQEHFTISEDFSALYILTYSLDTCLNGCLVLSLRVSL